MEKNKTRLAIFDIDGTIFRSSLLIQLINTLVEKGIFPPAAQEETEKEYLAWLNRKGSYEDYINKVTKIYIKFIAGKTFKKINEIAQQVIAFQKDRVYRFTRDLIQKLKKENYLLVAISGSPSYIVAGYARTIGFDLCFGTEMEIRNSRFTGKALNLDSAYDKAKIIRSIIKRYPSISLKKCLAVGDTESDIPMLNMVGNPIAFNPNKSLLKYARKKLFQTVIERKDVIYKLMNFETLN